MEKEKDVTNVDRQTDRQTDTKTHGQIFRI